MNNAQAGALSETIKKEYNGTKQWMMKYRPDMQVYQAELLNNAVENERKKYIHKHRRILEMQQKASKIPGTIDEECFLSRTQVEFKDPRRQTRNVTSSTISYGIQSNVTPDKAFKRMCKSLKSINSDDYSPVKEIEADYDEILYKGISKDGLGRKGFLQERSKLLPQEKYNEPTTASQEIGWFTTLRNPYSKFETLEYHRRKHNFS